MRRTPTTSRRYSRSICPVFVGATLRGRPSTRKISFQCRLRRHATNFVHFAALLLMTGSSFSKKAKPFWNFAVHSTAYNALLTRNSACKFRLKRHACARFRATTRRQNTPYIAHFSRLEKLRFFGGSSFFPQKQSFCGNPKKPLRMSVPKYEFPRAE